MYREFCKEILVQYCNQVTPYIQHEGDRLNRGKGALVNGYNKDRPYGAKNELPIFTVHWLHETNPHA